MPTLPIPGSFVHPSLIAYVLHGKFVNAMPLYRIEQDIATAGLKLSRQVIRNFLGSWSGYLTTDSHQPYFRLGPQVTNTACLVHLRRKFDEVVKSAGSDSLARKACSIALKGRQLIDAIFKADEAFNGMTSGDVQKPNATKS